MSPAINNRSTGAVPKSNRRCDRNRERDGPPVNQSSNVACNIFGRVHPHVPQHPNNLFQLWPSPSDQETTSSKSTARSAKNSNTRSHPTATTSALAYEFGDIGSYNSHSKLYPNIYVRHEATPRSKMTPPVDARTQSPPNFGVKLTNTPKMPQRSEVEGRLNKIREYIKVTSSMMNTLSEQPGPRAQAQREKLSMMREDLYVCENKLSKLMETSEKYWTENDGLDDSCRETELRKKVEESERKLAMLQAHQAELVGIQLTVRERLDKAREAQRVLLSEGAEDSEHECEDDQQTEQDEEDNENEHPTRNSVDQIERETEALRDKLLQLESKKRHMDQLVQELQEVELIERASSARSSEATRNMNQQEKEAELDAMRAQVAHLKAMMCKVSDPQLFSEQENEAVGNEIIHDESYHIEETNQSGFSSNSHNEIDESDRVKCSDHPSVEQIQAVTRELKEQQQLLKTARSELQRLKQLRSESPLNPTPSSVTSCSPPLSIPIEKKQSNNGVRQAQNKRRQLEDFMRKNSNEKEEQDQNHGLSINQNGGQEWINSQFNQLNTPGNLWPPPTHFVTGSLAPSIDGMSAADHILEAGSQLPMENGFGGNFWTMPSMLANQPPQAAASGTAEYYRQLLLGSQSQQLQLMSTTIQQCCQLLWAQQREMQSMKTDIVQLQTQLRHSQSRNNLDLQEDQHSNLGRAAAQTHFGSLEVTNLPPSSSLPNLVSLPSSSPAPIVLTSLNCQQPQQQPPPQLNNQVPPGNRANNYWDNFRSYSRQNLLSGSSKTVTDCATNTSTQAPSSTNATNGVVISTHTNNKCNRHHGQDSIPTSISSEVQYSLNIQQQQQQQQQQLSHTIHQQSQQQQPQQLQEREVMMASRRIYAPSNDSSAQLQQQPINVADDNVFSLLNEQQRGEDSCSRIAETINEWQDLRLFLKHCIKVSESRKKNDRSLPSSINSHKTSDSSDDDSETKARQKSVTSSTNGNMNTEVQSLSSEFTANNREFDSCSSLSILNSTSQSYFGEQSAFTDTFAFENAIANFPAAIISSEPLGNDEIIIKSEQTRPELTIKTEATTPEENNNSDIEIENTLNSTNQISQILTPQNVDVTVELNSEDEQVHAEYVCVAWPLAKFSDESTATSTTADTVRTVMATTDTARTVMATTDTARTVMATTDTARTVMATTDTATTVMATNNTVTTDTLTTVLSTPAAAATSTVIAPTETISESVRTLILLLK